MWAVIALDMDENKFEKEDAHSTGETETTYHAYFSKKSYLFQHARERRSMGRNLKPQVPSLRMSSVECDLHGQGQSHSSHPP
jgi:hypothetical protein